MRESASFRLLIKGQNFNPKFRKIRLVHQMERRTSFKSGPLWPVWSFRSVGPKCAFQFDKIVVPSTAVLYPAYKNNNQMRGGLGRVCTTGIYRSFWHLEFPKIQTRIFVKWKAPLVTRPGLIITASCISKPTFSCWLCTMLGKTYPKECTFLFLSLLRKIKDFHT